MTVIDEPIQPWPCGAPSPDLPGEVCGHYEDHEGPHGLWFPPLF